MQTHIEQKILPYTPQQMFDLVADVGAYKDFAPWCVASRVTRRESDTMFFADLVVGYKFLRERFSSKVILEGPDHIYIEYQKGPLKHLKNHWRFSEGKNGSGCVIDFSVEFEFKNNMLQGLAQVFFQEIIKRMVSSFEDRARELYGDDSS